MSGLVPANRMLKMVNLLEWATKLSVFRDDVLAVSDAESAEEMAKVIIPLIEGLDVAIVETGCVLHVATPFDPIGHTTVLLE